MNEKTKGLFAIALCAVLWSTSGLFIKIIPWHPMVIAGGRSLIAALFILGIRRLGRTGRDPDARRSLDRQLTRQQRRWVVLAALSYTATMISFVVANKMTASANVILLQYIAPVWAALFGWGIAKEKPGTEHWVALVAVALGLYLFFKDGLGGGSFAGDAIAMLSGLTFALYSVFMRLQKHGRPENAIILAHILTAVIGLPFIFSSPPILTLGSGAAMLALGIVQIGMASLLFAYAIRRISAVQAMLTAMVEPVLNPVWVFLATGEQPGASVLTGGAVILGAVLMSSLAGFRRRAA
jgi:drug/metabolite transporter (DMT)-like permease